MPPQNDDKNKIDLDKILLPKKEGPSVDSAQRVNAGALLAQEQAAELPKPAPAPAPTATPPAPKDDSIVKKLETYQGDIASVVNTKGSSVVSIAAAEANRRASQPMPAPQVQEGISLGHRLLYWGGGVLLLLIVAGAAVYIATRPTTVPVVPLATEAPFIAVDDTQVVQMQNPVRDNLMTLLTNARKAVHISLGLIERLDIGVAGTDQSGTKTLTEMPPQTLLRSLSPYVPEALIRTLGEQYLLGVHSYDENQAFLILSTDSYETAYAAMLQWEPTMRQDLLPLFERTPPVHANTDATSTPTTTPAVIASVFVDRVVENHDARVIQNEYGDILLLWTFLDRNTVVVATNEATLREIIARRTAAATLGLPR